MKKLNIGCGRDIRPIEEGWVNLDIREGGGVDVVHDLDRLPLPFDDDSFDEVYASHVLEHVLRWENLLHDIYRIMKPGGVLTIRVPYGLDPTAYHIRTFTEWTLDVFIAEITNEGGFSLEDEEKIFRQIKRRIRRQLFGKYTYHVNKYLHLNLPQWSRFNLGRKKEIWWILEAVKPDPCGSDGHMVEVDP